jgi:hypothetical protein
VELVKEWFKSKFKTLKIKFKILWTKIEISILKVKSVIKGYFKEIKIRKIQRSIDNLEFYLQNLSIEPHQTTEKIEEFIRAYEKEIETQVFALELSLHLS